MPTIRIQETDMLLTFTLYIDNALNLFCFFPRFFPLSLIKYSTLWFKHIPCQRNWIRQGKEATWASTTTQSTLALFISSISTVIAYSSCLIMCFCFLFVVFRPALAVLNTEHIPYLLTEHQHLHGVTMSREAMAGKWHENWREINTAHRRGVEAIWSAYETINMGRLSARCNGNAWY